MYTSHRCPPPKKYLPLKVKLSDDEMVFVEPLSDRFSPKFNKYWG